MTTIPGGMVDAGRAFVEKEGQTDNSRVGSLASRAASAATDTISRRGVMTAGGTAALPAWASLAVAQTDSGGVEIQTDATIPTDTSIDVTVYEDTTGDSSVDNQQQVSVSDGAETHTLGSLTGMNGDGYQYWAQLDLSTADDSVTPEFHELVITLPEEPADEISDEEEAHVWRAWLFPDEITRELTLGLFGMLGLFLYASMALRSLVVVITWGFLVLSLVFVILVDAPLVYFWLVAALNAVAVIISMGVYTSYGSSV